MWRKSRFKLVENRKNDLIWLLIHCVVRVRYALKSWGYIDNDKCAICCRVETLEHCFLECPRVVKLWRHFSPVFSALLDSPFCASPKSVYYPFSCVQSSTGVMISNYLLATILYWVWLARNRATFRNSPISSSKMIGLIKNDIRVRICGDHLDSVRNFWSFRNALCSIDINDKIAFFPLL